MLKIIDWTFASSEDPKRLQEEVRARMECGWQPFGGMTGIAYPEGVAWHIEYCQAMVKYATHDEPLLPVPEQYWDEMD